MWIIQYMSADDNFWRTLTYPRGKEKELLEKLNDLNEQGNITRVYKRCDPREVK